MYYDTWDIRLLIYLRYLYSRSHINPTLHYKAVLSLISKWLIRDKLLAEKQPLQISVSACSAGYFWKSSKLSYTIQFYMHGMRFVFPTWIIFGNVALPSKKILPLALLQHKVGNIYSHWMKRQKYCTFFWTVFPNSSTEENPPVHLQFNDLCIPGILSHT